MGERQKFFYIEINGHEYQLPFRQTSTISALLGVCRKNNYIPSDDNLRPYNSRNQIMNIHCKISQIPNNAQGKKKIVLKQKNQQILSKLDNLLDEAISKKSSIIGEQDVPEDLSNIVKKMSSFSSQSINIIEQKLNQIIQKMGTHNVHKQSNSDQKLDLILKMLEQTNSENEKLKNIIKEHEKKLQSKEQIISSLEQKLKIMEMNNHYEKQQISKTSDGNQLQKINNNILRTSLFNSQKYPSIADTLKKNIEQIQGSKVSSIQCLYSFKNMNIDYRTILRKLLEVLNLEKEHILMLIEVQGNLISVYSEGIIAQYGTYHGKGNGFLYSHKNQTLFESRKMGPLIKMQMIKLLVCNNFQIFGNKIMFNPQRQPSDVNGSKEDHQKVLMKKQNNVVQCLQFLHIHFDKNKKESSISDLINGSQKSQDATQ